MMDKDRFLCTIAILAFLAVLTIIGCLIMGFFLLLLKDCPYIALAILLIGGLGLSGLIIYHSLND